MNTTNITDTKKLTAVTVSVKRWARANQSAALAVVKAQELAAAERARVDTYIAPVFARFSFADEAGAAITDPRKLYRCEDDVKVAEYFAACDVAHREHGFAGEPGTCPALVAEHAATKTENALLDSLAAFTGTSEIGFCNSIEMRTKALGLALSTALAAVRS